MTDRERAIELINAYFDNKKIEFNDPKCRVNDWTSINDSAYWTYLGEFCKNLDNYRIKKEPIKRPYKTIQEFSIAQREHGPNVQFSSTVLNVPMSVYVLDDMLCMEFRTPAYKSMNSHELMHYCWQDGTPCYIIED